MRKLIHKFGILSVRRLVVIISLTLLPACEQKKDEGLTDLSCLADIETCDQRYLHTLFTSMCRYSPDVHFEFTDMGDGSVRKEYYHLSSNACDDRVVKIVVKRQYLMKCLQGQVYDAVQNNCRGTGTAPLWGAGLFQFCTADDRSCDMQESIDGLQEWVADPAISPAGQSCGVLTVAGRSWKLPREIGVYNRIDQVFPDIYTDYFPDIPAGVNIWTDWASYGADDTAVVYSYADAGNAYYPGSLAKTSMNYVQCATEEEFYPAD